MSITDIVVNNDKKESYVGKKLNDSTSKKVIILVLILIFSFPIFSPSTYIAEPNSFNIGLDILMILRNSNMTNEEKRTLFDQVVNL